MAPTIIRLLLHLTVSFRFYEKTQDIFDENRLLDILFCSINNVISGWSWSVFLLVYSNEELVPKA